MSLSSKSAMPSPNCAVGQLTKSRRVIMYMLTPKLVNKSVWYIGIMYLPRA